jgi:nucleoside-diphosphate-sugar epimerase
MLQTILGAGGAIGIGLAKELTSYTNHVRLVSRSPQKINATDEVFPADLTDRHKVDQAVAGSTIVYLVAGLEYKTSVWQRQWPLVMSNVIAACKNHKAKLVFFDNIYMYDKDYMSNITEDTPIKPTSKKGAVRAEIATMILNEVKQGRLTAIIVRAADFIGPKNSVLVEMVYLKLLKGKKANWFVSTNFLHSFTFTPDAAKGTALLGNTAEAYNQVWHLPTSAEKLTMRDWIQLFADELKVAPKVLVLPKPMVSILGIFVPILREFKEMIYQYDRDYFFNSSKFEKRFNFKPTPAKEAVKWIVENVKPSKK